MAQRYPRKFRGAAEKEAAQIIDDMRLVGINMTAIARQGIREKLREALTEEGKDLSSPAI